MSTHKKKAPKKPKFKQGKNRCLVRRKVSVKGHTRRVKRKGGSSAAAGKGSRVYATTSVKR